MFFISWRLSTGIHQFVIRICILSINMLCIKNWFTLFYFKFYDLAYYLIWLEVPYFRNCRNKIVHEILKLSMKSEKYFNFIVHETPTPSMSELFVHRPRLSVDNRGLWTIFHESYKTHAVQYAYLWLPEDPAFSTAGRLIFKCK